MEIEYRQITTEDGSPSLALAPTWEPMHSLEGAFSETLYIYQPTIENALLNTKKPYIASVGLGLGYNEIMTACELIRLGVKDCFVDSFESENFLIESFANWILQNELECELYSIYEMILKHYSQHYMLDQKLIREKLWELQQDGRLKFKAKLDLKSQLEKYNGILFDAFSSKTTAELWTPSFLDFFLVNAAASQCYLSTYACTGELKRTLEKHGFTVEKRKGFGKKRQSTFACRRSERS